MAPRIGWDTALSHALGGRTADRLAKLDLRTVGDLLDHRPRRYMENTVLTDLSALPVGEHVTVVAEVTSVNRRAYQRRGDARGRRGQLISVVIRDDAGGHLTLTFFDQPWHERDLVRGTRAVFSGKVADYRGSRQLNSPDYRVIDGSGSPAAAQGGAGDDVASTYARGLVPVYRLTRGVHAWHISDSVAHVLRVVDHLDDPVPPEVAGAHGLPTMAETYRLVHLPDSWADVAAARRRMAWNEAFVLQVELARRRRSALARTTVPRAAGSPGPLVSDLLRRLPFSLTAGQREVVEEILVDLARPHPMLRLLQGEVGSGKTVVALLAMLTVVDAGGQAALAPTEVLAVQHIRTLDALLGELGRAGQLGGDVHGTRVALLTGSLGTAARRSALLDAASGQAGIVVGTHALLQEHVSFADLGLVVVDEQHRFGVEQRDALRLKNDEPPHVLVMTATPIPRTVAMTVFGDLETSMLTELPAGRSVVSTTVVPAAEKPLWYERCWERVREEVAAGRQAYVVCPRIDDREGIGDGEGGGETDGETDGDGSWAEGDVDAGGTDLGGLAEAARPVAGVVPVAAELSEGALAGLRIEVLHGRLGSEVKDATMRAFAAGEIDVLVATTVIEVGIDVPNATVMVVLDAERFGASQLHQLRGRVGRGGHPGLCLLVTSGPDGTPSRTRLEEVSRTRDGFEVARVDLEQRREGDVLGVVQSGRRSRLRALSLLRDEGIIVAARREAAGLVAADPGLAEHPALAGAVAALVGEERGAYLEKA